MKKIEYIVSNVRYVRQSMVECDLLVDKITAHAYVGVPEYSTRLSVQIVDITLDGVGVFDPIIRNSIWTMLDRHRRAIYRSARQEEVAQ